MSYILEALRKSEQERDPHRVPDLETHHRHVITEKKSKLPYWFIGVALLVINVVYVVYQMNQNPEQQSENIAIRKTNGVTEPVQEVAAISSHPETRDEPNEAVLNSAIPAIPTIEEPLTPESADSGNLRLKNTEKSINLPSQSLPTNPLYRIAARDISELPLSLQDQIPSMEFTTHIYIADGGSFIIINGKSLSDGMLIERGLRVFQITSDGVILEYNQKRFFLPSMTDWHQY